MSGLSIMVGLGWTHIGFLAAGLAVAIPVIIHLLLRPRARKVEIGSIRFLTLVLRDSTRSRRLRRWLLLALRALAVMLLALLFARPYLTARGQHGRDLEAVILIDRSASMAVEQGGQSLFSKALEIAAKSIHELPPETSIHVGYFDTAVEEVTVERVQGKRDTPGFGGTDLAATLNWARDRLIHSGRSQKRLVLISDFQKSGLRQKTIGGWPSDAEVKFVEVGKPLLANVAIESVDVQLPVIRKNQPIDVTVNLRNVGKVPASNFQVRLALAGVAGVADQVQTVTLQPGMRATAAFKLSLSTPGDYQGRVDLVLNDEFTLDNVRHFGLEARLPDKILLLDGEPGLSVYANETYYLEAALRLQTAGRGRPITPYEPERVSWERGGTMPDLRAYRLVMPCNVPDFSAPARAALRAFVANGGSLLYFLGKHVKADAYAALRTDGLFPAEMVEAVPAGGYSLAEWDHSHAIFKPFADPQHGDLRHLSFGRYVKLRPGAESKTVATFPGSYPFLVESKLEQGTILVVSSSADSEWTEWPRTRLYVPLVHQLVGYLTRRLPENQRVQQRLSGPGQNHLPGVERSINGLYVSNIDTLESETARLTTLELKAVLGLPMREGTDSHGSRKADGQGQNESSHLEELWPWVLGILFVILLMELFVANRTHA